MFLFAQETKTPVSTYTDSYRPPNSVKKTFQEPSARLWKENKFVTKGFAIPPVPSSASPDQQEKLLKAAAEEFAYRNAVEPSAYLPEKYWVTRQEERYNPVFVNEDRYVTWRTSPYNSAAWNKYTTYLPRLPKEVKMEAMLESTARPEHLHRCEREVADMLSSFSRAPLPSVPQVYAAATRRPYQGYFSPCSGRHYCLRGMDYYGDVGRPDTSRHLHPLAERAVRNIPYCQSSPGVTCYALSCSLQPSCLYTSPKYVEWGAETGDRSSFWGEKVTKFLFQWDSSHFKKAGGVHRGTFTIHPEFVSESCSAPLGY